MRGIRVFVTVVAIAACGGDPGAAGDAGLDAAVDGPPGPDACGVSCYSGPAGTEGVGLCHAGLSCNGGACEGEVTVVAETCNASDDDCNGIIDDGTAVACYPVGVAGCDSLTGICVGTCMLGERACQSGMLDSCTGATIPRTEICCNSLDDDCDGLVDGADSDCVGSGAVSLAVRVGAVGGDTGRAAAALPDGGGLVAGDNSADGIVTRYAANGTLSWSRGFSGTGYSSVQAVTALADGTSFLTGDFAGSVTFAPGISHLAVGSADLFVARFDGTGSLVWLRPIGSTGTDEARAMVQMSDGSILVGGSIAGSATFGAGELTATTLPAGAFLARFAADGSLMSASSIGTVRIRGLARRSDDSVVVAGSFSGAVTLGAGQLGATTLTAAGASDAWVASYGASGALAWARSQGGAGNEETFAVDTVAGGDVIVAGSLTMSAVFGAGEPATTTLSSAGGSDAFVARFGASGNLVWARSGGSARDDVAFGVAAALDGGVVVVGRYGSLTATFGADGSGCPTMLSPGASGVSSTDAFVLKYDSTGSLLWGRKGGGSAVDSAYGVDITANGGAMVVGDFGGVATFGSFTLTQGDSLGDAFVAHYQP